MSVCSKLYVRNYHIYVTQSTNGWRNSRRIEFIPPHSSNFVVQSKTLCCANRHTCVLSRNTCFKKRWLLLSIRLYVLSLSYTFLLINVIIIAEEKLSYRTILLRERNNIPISELCYSGAIVATKGITAEARRVWHDRILSFFVFL